MAKNVTDERLYINKFSNHITYKEMWSNDRADIPYDVLFNAHETAKHFETIRHYAGSQPITITSFWRSEQYNKKVGGAKNSQHLLGKAIDMMHNYKTASQLCVIILDLIERNHIPDGGVGLYLNRNAEFVHYDWREERSRWCDFRTSKEIKDGVRISQAAAWVDQEKRNKLIPKGFL